jgi:hypothetical protein
MIEKPPVPLALSDYQLKMVMRAASAIPQDRRGDFLRGLSRRLAPEPCDTAVAHALNLQVNLTPHDDVFDTRRPSRPSRSSHHVLADSGD